MRRTLVLTMTLLMLAGCQTGDRAAGAAHDPAADLDLLVSWMTGTFASTTQHQADPDNFFDIRLVMLPIWPDRADGRWFYVEQAAADRLEKPYRQRVYRVMVHADGTFVSTVFSLANDKDRAIGCWLVDNAEGVLDPDTLLERTGCDIVLRRTDHSTFEGSTQGRACQSTLGGASYATSQVTITALGMESWDRGWNDMGIQVWGATKGPYRFDRLSDQMPH